MGSRDRVRMTEDETRDFLAGQLKVQVAVNGHDGTPHLTTLFYVLDEEDRIFFWTYGSSQKIKNLERDDRISALVEDGTEYAELRGASVKGRAELVRDRERLLRLGGAVAVAMTGVGSLDDLGELGRAEVERQVTKRVGVLVHPEHVATWDHRKLSAPPTEGA